MSLPSPLVWLCGVRVNLDGSVTISDGCIWFLHLDIDTEDRDVSGYYFKREKTPLYIQKENISTSKRGVPPCSLGIKNS